MNRKVMMRFYSTYIDPIENAVKDDAEYAEQIESFKKKEADFVCDLKLIGNGLYERYEEVSNLYEAANALMARNVYLLGADDAAQIIKAVNE